MPESIDLSIATLRKAYLDGSASPREVISRILAACDEGDPGIWIQRLTEEQVFGYVEKLEGKDPEALPLFGIPFAIKDNIDLAGIPTTAGCAEYAYTPNESAFAVQRLLDAGAIPIGKTNLDQFATGLVGLRSPYPPPKNPYNADYIPGGSSSGSAVAVSAGLVSFSLGTDTAGSGRVPASLNNLVGLKPSRGLVSCRGVVPACRTLDCVTVFAETINDGAAVLDVMAGFDAADPYSRPLAPPETPFTEIAKARIGIPRADQLEFFGDEECAALFAQAREHCAELGWEVVEIDFAPFLEAALLLYEGPWVAERLAAIEEFLTEKPEAVFPVTRNIIQGGRTLSAVSAFRAEYRLRELKRRADRTWEQVDAVLTPTFGKPYRVSEVEADPIRTNSNLGYYTNFMNLLDCAAVADPAGNLVSSGLPWGVTFFGPAFSDPFLLKLSSVYLATEAASPTTSPAFDLPGNASAQDRIEIAVCGAHLSGLPLNHQLTSRGGWLVESTETAPVYRMIELPATETLPPRPGLFRVSEGGNSIAVEIWSLPTIHLGSFMNLIGAPLGIGRLQLTDDRLVLGFLCEADAANAATDITHFGSWRNFIAQK